MNKPPQDTWEEDMGVLFDQAYDCGKLKHDKDHLRVIKHRYSLIIAKELETQREQIAKEICAWTDDIEVERYSNASMDVWKLFKHIRNGIRDKYLKGRG